MNVCAWLMSVKTLVSFATTTVPPDARGAAAAAARRNSQCPATVSASVRGLIRFGPMPTRPRRPPVPNGMSHRNESTISPTGASSANRLSSAALTNGCSAESQRFRAAAAAAPPFGCSATSASRLLKSGPVIFLRYFFADMTTSEQPYAGTGPSWLAAPSATGRLVAGHRRPPDAEDGRVFLRLPGMADPGEHDIGARPVEHHAPVWQVDPESAADQEDCRGPRLAGHPLRALVAAVRAARRRPRIRCRSPRPSPVRLAGFRVAAPCPVARSASVSP